MRFLGVLFVGVCYANGDVVTSLNSEQPKETKASVDARLALVAACPEATSNCSVPTGPVAQNEELADALDCMLRINLTTIDPGPCHDALEQFLNDHLNPLNRLMPQMPPFPMGPQFPMAPQMPQFPMSPTMLIMRPQSQPGPMPMSSPLAALLQRMAAAGDQDPRSQQSPFQYSRFQPSQSRVSRYSPEQDYFPIPSRDSFPSHGFPMSSGRPPMASMSRYRDDDRFSMRSDSYDQDRYSRSSRWGDDEDGHWELVWHSDRQPESYSSYPSMHGSHGHQMSPPSRHMPPPSRHMPPPSRHMPPPSRHMPPPSRQMSQSSRMPPSRSRSMPSRSSSRDSSSSMMSPMMMMILPHIMKQDSTSQNPMSGLLMATLMKKMSSSSDEYNDYDYDYGYDYDNDDAGSSDEYNDYDYEYEYEDDSSPSPLSSIIQQMLQQRLTEAREPVVEVSTSPMTEGEEIDASSSLELPEQDPTPEAPTQRTTVEIAQPSRATRSEKGIRSSEQVSYRNAP